ncbi:MAG TPA: hypothetical protein P5560_02230 [Thermotogota bacterium]|nr:hypothetical protein [Thermotogota bacterium]HRW91746.1 hypothetical protein [Thermotogota bacterium]
MKKGWVLLGLLAFLVVGLFGSYEDEAMDLFFSGKGAYNSGSYEDAQRLLKSALELDPKIEAKAPTIKYMIGVSAFKNGDYSTAKTMLSLFPENPVAMDLLLKIAEFEKNLPEDFYYTGTTQERTPPAVLLQATSTESSSEAGAGLSPVLVVLVALVVFVSLFLFLEIKLNLFSTLATRLSKSGSVTVTMQPRSAPVTEAIASGSMPSREEIPPNLLETPFEEPIDIDSMAEKEISELSRVFGTPKKTADQEETPYAPQTEEQAKEDMLHSFQQQASSGEPPEPQAIPVDQLPEDFHPEKVRARIKELFEKIPTPTKEKEFLPIDQVEEQQNQTVTLDDFDAVEDWDSAKLEKFFDFVFQESEEHSTT